jgi:small subunit ribosomal protein S1
VENPDEIVGRHVTFKIAEYGEKGRNIVLSNRAVLEEERQQQKNALRASLHDGAKVQGEITAIKKFGAFVDIGGVEGLIPVSEVSWGRVEDIGSVLTVGQTVEVAVKKLDWENDTFSFSLKEATPDPWTSIGQRYPEGSHHQGKISRLAQFGAFVTLEPGVDGLLHISELGKGKRINHPREVVEENQPITVKVNKVDQEKKRLSLALASEDQDGEQEQDYKEHLTVTSGKSSGSSATLGDILKAKMAKKKAK